MSMYKTQSMNPYKAVVATDRTLKDPVPMSKFIGVHHCSIEFKAASLKPAIQIEQESASSLSTRQEEKYAFKQNSISKKRHNSTVSSKESNADQGIGSR